MIRFRARWCLAPLLLVALLFTACGVAPSEDELLGRGGPTPQAVVESFLTSLNEALQADLTAATERRAWAERLASYFAPSERADQRVVFAQMLADYAASATRPAYGSAIHTELSYSGIELLARDGDRATVRVVDGQVLLQWLDDEGEVVRERTGALSALLDQTEGLPVVRVGGSWFMTEG